MINVNQSPMRDDKEEEMSRSALAMFRAKEEEIERKKMEVRDKVHAYLGRVEEETKRLAEIREVSVWFSSKLSCFICFLVLYVSHINQHIACLVPHSRYAFHVKQPIVITSTSET